MITELLPLYKQFKTVSPLLTEETSVEPIPIFPDVVEYELKEFPIKGNKVTLPWGARVINIGDQTMAVMVAVEKKEDEE